jgi:hypothetical protein
MITGQTVAEKLSDYLHHRLTLEELIEWAEQSMMEEEFDENELETVRDIVSRLGLADVCAFGLTWEDCEAFLTRLGYQVRVEIFLAG